MSITRIRVFTFVSTTLVALLGSGFGSEAGAQTVNGTLMEVETDRAISLGLIILLTESGDSITSTVTNAQGQFSISSPDPGAFILIASAFGFKETAAGVFELGPDGEVDIEFRVGAQPMAIDGLLVELQRPALQHNLITNGFVRRLTRGLGHFITPGVIERSSAIATVDLLRSVPGVIVSQPTGGVFSYVGDQVQLQGIGGFCNPTVYVDGMRVSSGVMVGQSLDALVPRPVVDAIEVYRRPAEVPIEYGITQSASPGGACGVLIFWTKRR